MTSDCLADNNYYVLGRLYQYLRGKTAVKERDRDRLRNLLETNFEVNYKLPPNSFVCRRRPEYSGNTALHLLAEFGHDGFLLDWLVELGADLSSGQRQNALTGAWSIDTLKIVMELDCNFVIWRWLSEIEHHCYLYGQLGLTSLHFACALGDLAAARKALEAGIDVNQRVDDYSPIWPGDTALHVLYRESTRFVHGMAELLLKHGADVTLKNAAQRSPLHLSGERRMLEALLGLMRKTGRFTTENPVDDNGLSHFHLCCMTNDLVAVDEFLKAGVSIDDPVDYFADDYAGYTPLHFAAIYSDKRIVRLLIDEGAILLKNAYGQTPLDLAQSKLEGLEI